LPAPGRSGIPAGVNRSRINRSTERLAVSSTRVFQLKITLRYLEPPIWRRVLVQDDFTLTQLHGIIQLAMAWDGCHMHEFRMPARGFGPPLRTFGSEGVDETATLLREVLVRQGQMLLYEYDFGDGWLHGIRLEKILPLERRQRYPVCLAGARA